MKKDKSLLVLPIIGSFAVTSVVLLVHKTMPMEMLVYCEFCCLDVNGRAILKHSFGRCPFVY